MEQIRTIEPQGYYKRAIAACDALIKKHMPDDPQPLALTRCGLSRLQVKRMTRMAQPITERWAVL